MKTLRKIIIASLLALCGCTVKETDARGETAGISVTEEGTYDQKDEVALYIVTYHHLPSNYMTKTQARKHGWEGGALSTVLEGMCIGGGEYGNYEEALPVIDGRTYYECDIDTLNGKSRGAKRIVYTDDGWNVYYTEDHYETFEHLYGDDEYENG